MDGRGERQARGRLHSRVSNQSSLIRTRRTSSSSLPSSLLHVEGVSVRTHWVVGKNIRNTILFHETTMESIVRKNGSIYLNGEGVVVWET